MQSFIGSCPTNCKDFSKVDTCIDGSCFCGAYRGAPCAQSTDTCISGTCTCGSRDACTGNTDTCDNGTCKCGKEKDLVLCNKICHFRTDT